MLVWRASRGDMIDALSTSRYSVKLGNFCVVAIHGWYLEEGIYESERITCRTFGRI